MVLFTGNWMQFEYKIYNINPQAIWLVSVTLITSEMDVIQKLIVLFSAI